MSNCCGARFISQSLRHKCRTTVFQRYRYEGIKMLPGIVFILIGIGVFFYNTQQASKLVIRGTNIDLGYLIIALGLINFVLGYLRMQRIKKLNQDKK